VAGQQGGLPGQQTGPAPALPPLPAARGTGSGMRPAAIAPPDTHTVVDLYNATARKGLATSVGGWLAASGWPVDKTAGAAAQSRTTILYGKGAAQAAEQLAAALGVRATPAPSARTAAGHVLIRLGEDYTLPGGPQMPAPSDTTGPVPATPSTPDPAGVPDPAGSSGIAMDSGITCVN
jgi:hypothetical protein